MSSVDPDITVGSLLHRIVAYKPTTSVSPNRVTIHLVSVGIAYVMVQPELERRSSPLVSIPPFGRGYSRHGVFSIR